MNPLCPPPERHEYQWPRRRSFMQAVTAWGGLVMAGAAQSRSVNVVEMRGPVGCNGQPLRPGQDIRLGDEIETGRGGTLVFVLGDAAFHVRQNTRLRVEGRPEAGLVSLLRLLAGGVVSVWGKRDASRQIVLPVMTAGIRGTGAYAEILAEQNGRGYVCNCYGTIAMQVGDEQVLTETDYHQAFWGEVSPRNGSRLTPAPVLNHTDEELEQLAALLNLRTAWQILGRKGSYAPVSP